ncbi:MAG: SMI1/KNR4 family protein [Cyanothece sp. SIO1E1]|nr:SMI1/KNR4 family protein [Cyanothece sp. SIO1E1]
MQSKPIKSMSTHFSETLDAIKASANEELAGYETDEISKIERLYDIIIVGDFRSFLKLAGKCSGGVIGDRDMILYRRTMTLRSHLLLQTGFRNDLQDLGLFDIVGMKPFVFSIESETVYYFLSTAAKDSQKVYLLDENNDQIRETAWNFSDYIEQQVLAGRKHKSNAICKSDLLLI